MIEVINQTLVIAAIIPLILGIALYWRLPWRTSAEGRAVMTQKWVMAAMFAYFAFSVIVPESLPKEIARLTIWILANIAFWRFVFVISEARRNYKTKE